MKYILTNTSIEFENHTLYQLQEIDMWGFKGKKVGYIDNDQFLSMPKNKFNIGTNAKIYNTQFCGHIYIGNNSVISNSIIRGSISIGADCIIKDSILSTKIDKVAAFRNNTHINGQDILAIGIYTPKLFEDGQFITKMHNGIALILTDHYCRVNCKTMTYEEAWDYLCDDDKWQHLAITNYRDSQTVFLPSTKEWLREECYTQLQRLQIKKIEQGT